MAETMNKESFDLESVYDEQIAPLMTQLIEICAKHKLPMFATFLYANDPDGDGAGICTTNQMYKERPIPEELESLVDIVVPRRVPPLHLKVTHADGSVDMTTIIG